MSGKSGVVLYYFTLAMTAVYAILGIYVMAANNAGIDRLLPGVKKYVVGTLLVLYAAYRTYRLYRIKQGLDEID